MRKSILIALLSILLIGSAAAQDYPMALHISNPIGMFLKVGLKLEYRVNNIGILVMGRIYYGGPPKYPGQQIGAAFRYYFENEEAKRYENFLYSKVIAGHLDYFAGSGSGFTRIQDVPESNYYGIGAGWGRRYNFNNFFFEFNAGLKYARPDVAQEIAFYATGPGSIVELNFNLGFKF